MRRFFLSIHRDERGVAATVVIVSIVFILALLALVIDGGNLFTQRRSIVNATDSAALAAAQVYARSESGAVCGSNDGPARTAADQAATANNASATRIYYRCPSDGPGTVRVGYRATVPGLFSGNKVVSTAATAIWGAAAGGENLLPIELDSSLVEGSCGVPDPNPGQPCVFWYDANNTSSQWGWLNLCSQDAANNGACPLSKVGWDVSSSKQCPNSGNLGPTVIQNGFPYGLTMENPPPTYVCIDTGFGGQSWQDIRVNTLGIMPVNDPTKEIFRNGKPDKYAITGLTGLQILFVGQGNKAATITSCGHPPAWVSSPANAICIKAQWLGPQEIPAPPCPTCPNLGVSAIALKS